MTHSRPPKCPHGRGCGVCGDDSEVRRKRDATDPDEWDMTPAALPLHVYPTFGREHVIDADCWCVPTVDDGVVIHRSVS